ncbi:MAG TPA: hypothetical protein VEI95_11315 [Acidobacteriota bacterium]|nr:hypothetical protein [Acidobacteriota bacterium]
MAFNPIKFLALAGQFRLVTSYLSVLLLLLDLLTLELITHQRACTKPKSTTDRSASSGMANGKTNKAAGGSAAQSAYPSAFFPR